MVEQTKDFLVKDLCFENVLGFLNFSVIKQIKDLDEKFIEYAAYHYNQVQKTEEFAELSPENVQILLKRNDVNANENKVFQSLMNWINFDDDNRQVFLPKLCQAKINRGCNLSYWRPDLKLRFLQHC